MDFWIICTAIFVALPAVFLGNFLILRKMAMLSDALSHAVLPGMVLGYLLSENRQSPWLFVWAFVFILLAIFLVYLLQNRLQLPSDQSIGTTYIWLFSGGIFLLSYFSQSVDLEPDHILFGEIQYAFLPPYLSLGKWNIPLVFIPVFVNAILMALFCFFYFQTLKILSFDRFFAQMRGLKLFFWELLILIFVALTTMVSFEQVGSIMVMGFFVIIPCTSFLIARSFLQLFLYGIILIFLTSILGYYGAVYLDVSVLGSMMVLMSIFFIFAFIFQQFFIKKLVLKPFNFYEQNQKRSQQSSHLQQKSKI